MNWINPEKKLPCVFPDAAYAGNTAGIPERKMNQTANIVTNLLF